MPDLDYVVVTVVAAVTDHMEAVSIFSGHLVVKAHELVLISAKKKLVLVLKAFMSAGSAAEDGAIVRDLVAV